jgi:hypothetical protein
MTSTPCLPIARPSFQAFNTTKILINKKMIMWVAQILFNKPIFEHPSK